MILESRELPEKREIVSDIREQGKTLTGYAIVFNSPSKILRDNDHGEFTEIILPGAFDASLATGRSSIKNQAVSFVWRHDAMSEYGNTETNLKLEKDDYGIKFTLDLPEYANNLREVVSTGRATGMSFEFYVLKDRWEGQTRYVESGDLVHLSVVPNPAYAAASVEVREAPSMIWALRLDLMRKKLKYRV